MTFQPGNKLAIGRPKGVPNKINIEIRDMIRQALDAAGGVSYLTRQASANPVAFMGLVGRCMPSNITNNVTLSLESILDAAYARRRGTLQQLDSGMATEPRQLRQE